uniref:Cytosolic non-specific dipeptidase 2 (CNDP2) n=1 Tax=Triatoma infestans TaxID=30076 RepID=A0A171AII2_TRIIF
MKKKNGKDKLIMSFTELFIPFQNHKSQFEFNNVKKSDIFDDIFNSFPFADMDGGFFEKHDKQSVLKRHKVPKRKYEKNLISSTNSTNSKVILKNDGKDEIPKHSLLNRFETEFFKAPNVITLFSKDNNSDEMCCSHEECHKGDQCAPDKCKLNININEDSNLNNENNLNKKSILLDKTCLIYAIPGLIGIGALIFGIEVLRRHNELVKQTPFLSQYNQVQTC